MTGSVHLERLERVARTTAPMCVTIQELFCSRVDRIQDAEVYCIGVALASPALRALKEAWASEEPSKEQQRRHVPYDSEGHISLAYILASSRQQAERFVVQHHQDMSSRSLTVSSITYEDELGKETAIALAGATTTAVPGSPPRKRARTGSRAATDGPIEIDGSVLEGGGQILRMSGSYCALFGVPVHITKIRAGRSKPGLAAQHLESLRLVRDVSGGVLTNDRVGSCEVSIAPGLLNPGSFSADPGTAGAITLMVQASLFPLLFAGGDCTCNLRGGTDVSFSPPLDFLHRVLMPMLERMGAPFSVECQTRGFFPRGGGEVRVHVPPLTRELQPINLSERGEPARAEVVLHSTLPLGGKEHAVLEAVHRAAASLAPAVHVEFSQEAMPKSDRKHKSWVDIVVSTTSGALFHGGSDPKDLRVDDFAQLASAAVAEAAKPLAVQLASGAAVDEHLCDQLILPASLAKGTSRLLAAEPSLHTRTAIHIAELFMPEVRITEERHGSLSLLEVHGIGLTPGDAGSSAASVPAPETASAAKPSSPKRVPAPKATLRAANPVPGKVHNPYAVPWVAPKAGAVEKELQLRVGSLAGAAQQLLADIRNDLALLSETAGLEVTANVKADCIIMRGGPEECQAVQDDLRQMLEFYFGEGAIIAA